MDDSPLSQANPLDKELVARIGTEIQRSDWLAREIDRLAADGWSLTTITAAVTTSITVTLAAAMQYTVLMEAFERMKLAPEPRVRRQHRPPAEEPVRRTNHTAPVIKPTETELEVEIAEQPSQLALSHEPTSLAVVPDAPLAVPKRRGRPPGSKNVGTSLAVAPGSKIVSTSHAGDRRPHISSSEIHEILENLMTQNKIKKLSMRDHGELIEEAFGNLPALKGLPRHERNRRIIDACSGRQKGPVLRSEGRKRFIQIIK